MNIIRVVSRFTLPRLDTRSLAERLAVMPAVVVTGARQTGKSTLAQELTPGDRRFFTLDDLIVRDAARRLRDSVLELEGRQGARSWPATRWWMILSKSPQEQRRRVPR